MNDIVFQSKKYQITITGNEGVIRAGKIAEPH